MEDTLKKIALLLVIVGILSIGSIFIAIVLAFSSDASLASGSVAVIPIKGTIAFGDDPWGDTVDPDQVSDWLKQADEDPAVKIILLDINSPGGSPVASDEIGAAVRRTNKTVVAWIRESGASGAYWIASNTDHIIANRMSITGSIGVTASYIEFGGTLERYNASYQEFHSGILKEVGSPYREPTASERRLFQAKIDKIHQFFIEEVRRNRNLTDAQVASISTGEFFLGTEARDLGLVDELGSQDEVKQYLKVAIGEEPTYAYYAKPRTFFQELGMLRSNFFPGVSSGVTVRT